MLDQQRLRTGVEPCIAVVLVLAQLRGGQERDLLVQDRVVTGRRDVARGDKRQPQKIVLAPGPHAASFRRVPPMQHIALLELMRRSFKDVRARARWVAEEHAEYVL